MTYRSDSDCEDCIFTEGGVDRINAAVGSLGRVDGTWCLSKDGMRQVIEAASWLVESGEEDQERWTMMMCSTD